MNARSAWLPLTGQTREDTRLTAFGALTPTSPASTRSGVLPGSYDGRYRISGFWLAGNSGAMTAVVSSGRAVVQAAETRGAYPVTVVDEPTLTFADGDAQYTRIDLVVLRVYDNTYDGLGRTEATVEIVQGTPADTPAAPAAPDLSLPLFQVKVPAGASTGSGGIAWDTALTDLRTPAVALGGILPATAGDTVAGAYPGQFRDLDGTLQRWDGTAWGAYPQGIGGVAPATVTTGGYTGQYRDAPNGVLQRWSGSAWTSAVVTPAFASSLDAGSTTSTTYTATLSGTGVASLDLGFVAPPTGAVLLHFGARMTTIGSTTATAYMSPKVTQGSTVYFSPGNDEYSAMYGGPVGGSVSTMWRLYGLTPGATYTMTALHRSSDASVTCWFDNIFMRVDPAN
ncbi:hypothetical protein [Streptomyces malaysiense]|uniref:Uncharacterized protein n=1 Tax=Streptomyces malaysiense TaxID=1428626 RepID=A0A1J4PYN7_9ACTN|nr:hypothetical protein [Streptomyces malaysiense]OIK25865.1 hypothetical protein VT52_019270 [Streptomyces malaysiense]